MKIVWEVTSSGYRRFFSDREVAEKFIAGLRKVLVKQFGVGEYEINLTSHEIDAKL